MKAVRIVKPGELHVIDVEKPVIDETNNVLIKMTAAGVCGSDLGIYKGTNAAATYPRILGHEMVGVVAEVGPTATKVKVGDRVIVDQVVACGHCYACRKGRPNVCGNLKVRGVHAEGGYREYITVPDKDCYLVPEGLTDAEAVMIEPTTIAENCCSRAEIGPDDAVLIFGCGSLGASILRIAKLYNPAQLIVADIDDVKLQEALAMGATAVINSKQENVPARCKELTDGYGVTVAIDCAFIPQSMLILTEACGNAGRVMSMGFSVEPVPVNPFWITSKELDVRGSRLQNRKFQLVIDRINRGEVDLKGSVSHTFSLLEAQKAFDFAMSGDPSYRKVVLTFDF